MSRFARRTLVPALHGLLAHRQRALLAVVSIAIGTTAVVFTNALAGGAEAGMARAMEGLGSNLLIVRPAEVPRSAARRTLRGVATTLERDDAVAIAALPQVARAVPAAEGRAVLRAGRVTTAAGLLGTTTGFAPARNLRLRSGRFLSADDDAARRRVVVLAARVADTLFPGRDPVGQVIRVRGIPFTVVGALEAKGELPDGSDLDGMVFLPLATHSRRVLNTRWLTGIVVSVREESEVEAVRAAIGELLRSRHRAGEPGRAADFEIQNPVRTLAMRRQTMLLLSQLGNGLAALSLLVGGGGVLALMLTAVSERAVEIGLRMAVGARPRDVLAQFLGEAMLLVFGGWGVGLLLGVLSATAVSQLTDWELAIPGRALAASLATVAVLGLGSGTYPARRASLLPPIVALGRA